MVFRNLAVRTGQNFQSDVFLQPHVLTLEHPARRPGAPGGQARSGSAQALRKLDNDSVDNGGVANRRNSRRHRKSPASLTLTL